MKLLDTSLRPGLAERVLLLVLVLTMLVSLPGAYRRDHWRQQVAQAVRDSYPKLAAAPLSAGDRASLALLVDSVVKVSLPDDVDGGGKFLLLIPFELLDWKRHAFWEDTIPPRVLVQADSAGREEFDWARVDPTWLREFRLPSAGPKAAGDGQSKIVWVCTSATTRPYNEVVARHLGTLNGSYAPPGCR